MATSTALLPACNAMTDPPSSNTAADIASATTSAICQGPLPIQLISASPTPTPTETPTTSSPTRRNRCPSETPRQTTAAIGAKNGCACPMTSVATIQARPADRAHWTIGNAAPRHRPTPRPTASRTAPTTHHPPSRAIALAACVKGCQLDTLFVELTPLHACGPLLARLVMGPHRQRTQLRNRQPPNATGVPSTYARREPPDQTCRGSGGSAPRGSTQGDQAARKPGNTTDRASDQPKRSRRLRIRVSKELGTTVPLLILPNLPSSQRQRSKRPQKPLIGPVRPRHRPKPLPPSPPQLIKPPVIPSPGIRISSNRVPSMQSPLSQQGPSLRKVRIGPNDLAGISTAISGSLRLRAFGKTSRLGPEEVLNHAAHRAS